MKNYILPVLAIISIHPKLEAQGMKMAERMIISHPILKKETKPEVFQSHLINNLVPAWNVVHPKENIHSFRADRGAGKGQFLIAAGVSLDGFDVKRLSWVLADFVSNPESFIEYQLIGANHFKSLPMAGILGIHYIQVRPDRAADFEKFVVDKLHPALGQLLPDMQMLYYKAIAGESKLPSEHNYLTIFTIESPDARHKYWPEGAPETEVLKQAFKPFTGLATSLADYLVEGSYLLPGNGAAAIFESRKWTDFIHHSHLK